MRKVSNPMTETIENTANLPYKNPELPTEERIADLLGRMTLEEKVGQMMQLDARSGDLDDLIVNKHVGSILHTSPSDLPKAVETVNTKTRLGIPLVIGDDCIHGYSFWPGATIFPEQLGDGVIKAALFDAPAAVDQQHLAGIGFDGLGQMNDLAFAKVNFRADVIEEILHICHLPFVLGREFLPLVHIQSPPRWRPKAPGRWALYPYLRPRPSTLPGEGLFF